ncbi:hypothetical protein FRACYDRAFT_246381 [Fragilariopsis cylindrus CCMP1102]|uniref:Uncharacterized protein n=1 Tax=Fragilariopsis cylindrus CCMP1102 TaxID=635003 RepID=A0A1E7EZ21_9STRA|nr:hypothetical protein FRACYDRAFT_246381 [Fragilariopsis cylindrus CCMP1102]|eukprot:OEU11268.1 hypothetical protein FRACYDRAFT_246381 [Fragilariopsis cylindrus CCMP1102]
MISPSSSLHCSPVAATATAAMAIMHSSSHSQSQLLSPPQEGNSDGNSISNVNGSNSNSNGIAMNVILNGEEQGQMRIAFELIEEALLDDIRDLVHEQRRVEYNNNNTVLEHHCNNIFDSWVYQNLAEEALLIHNDPITSIRLYNEALCLLPTLSSMTMTKTKTKVSSSAMNTSTATSMTTSTTTTNKNNNGDDAVTTIGDDDDDVDHGNESNNDNNCDNNDEDNVCIAELERGIIQLNMAAIIQQYQMHFVMPPPLTSVNADNNNNNHTCSDSSDDSYNTCAFDLYCKSLNVLSYWLSDIHPTVLQAKSINPCHLMYAFGY